MTIKMSFIIKYDLNVIVLGLSLWFKERVFGLSLWFKELVLLIDYIKKWHRKHCLDL